MITVHHLENSRSQRVLWLLEELGLPYEVKRYNRDKTTSLAPQELKAVHPLGKSPVIEDDGRVIAETGAIVEYLIDRRGGGRLKPPAGSPEEMAYRYWVHAAEGSYMPAMVLGLFLNRMETAPMPFFARPIAKRLVKAVRDGYLDHTVQGLLEHLATELSKSDYLAGPDLTGADIMMSFPCEAALQRIEAAKSIRSLKVYVDRLHARPAFTRALKKGGPYAFA
jgi:glutathione S-transferase